MAKHIQQVAGDLPAAQIQLMQHQCTQLPARNYPRRKQTTTGRWKLQNHRTPEILTSWKPSDLQKLDAHHDKCTRCSDTLHAKGFQCPARKFQCKICHKFGSLHYCVLSEKSRPTVIHFFSVKKTQGTRNSSRGPIHPP